MDTLDNIKKQMQDRAAARSEHAGFSVPDGYFDALQEKIEESIPESQKIRKIPIWRNVGIAASICLFLACVFLMNSNMGTENSSALAMTDLSSEESMDYLLDSEVLELTSDDILELEDIDEILESLEEEYIEN